MLEEDHKLKANMGNKTSTVSNKKTEREKERNKENEGIS